MHIILCFILEAFRGFYILNGGDQSWQYSFSTDYRETMLIAREFTKNVFCINNASVMVNMQMNH